MQILILTTGGTIDKVYFDARSEYEVGDPQIAEILRGVGVNFDWSIETLLRKDSLEMTDDDREQVAEKVHSSPVRRVLVTHGTDTMADTARAVENYGDLGERTVVFVGSLQPARFKGSDAEFNIGFAIGALQTLPSGVYVAMNGRVFPAAAATKNRDANRFEGAALED